MKLISLQSGSNGNCFYIEADGVRLLIDAGISGRQAQTRLAAHGRDIGQVDALLISHDHRDHCSGMGIYHRKFALPLYVSPRTLAAAERRMNPGNLRELHELVPGSPLRFGHVVVQTVRTPHDGVDGVGFVVDDGRHRLGVLTDLGHVFAGLQEVVASLDAVVLESNFDPGMLAAGRYPEFLQQRIRGPHGHLSNLDSTALLNGAMGGRLKWACLAHLSEENNSPEVALATHREVLGDRIELFVASRYRATDVLEL
jgi:phosphoribosyl 1,2-cyclic phosphodiesterase